MPNIKSAKKRAIQSEKRRLCNNARKTSVKTACKKVVTALESSLPVEDTKVLLRNAEALLARAKGKGLIPANTAARRISRLAKKVAQATRTK
jgi:small subunit ribosomal protein S20